MKRELSIFLSICLWFLLSGSVYTSDGQQPFEGITLNALLEGHPTDRVVAKLLPEFENETGIAVNIEVIPFEEMTKRAKTTLEKKSDRYDVYMDGWVNAIEWAANGDLNSLDEYIKNPVTNRYIDLQDFVQAYIADAKYKEKLYGLPMYGESTFLYYRKDLFSLYGIEIPQTMEDVKDAAKQIKEKTQGKVYGVTLRGREGIHAVYVWASFLWAFGGHWIDENGKCDLNTPEAIASVNFYADLLRNYGPPAYNEFGWIENRDLFEQGRAAISIDATVNGAYNEDKKNSLVAGKVGYMPTPKSSGANLKGGQSSLITHQMYISRYSKHKEAAFLFISWATSKYVQLKGLEIEPNCGVTSKSAINSSLYQEKFGAFKESMLASLKNGNPDYIPTIDKGPKIFEKVGKALSNVLMGKETSEKAMQRVNKEINREILNKK